MRKINQVISAVAMAIALSVTYPAMSQDTGTQFVPYSDALAKCSAEWKQSETRRKTEKGKGVEAWNNFRRACVVEKGYVKGKKAPAAKGTEG